MRGEPADSADGLIDISDLSLRDLARCDNSILLLELRRILRASPADADPVAGWTNSV